MNVPSPDFFGPISSIDSSINSIEETGLNGFLGLAPVGRGMPGNIKVPDSIAKQLPKPIRDFFKPPVGTEEDQKQKDRKKKVLRLSDAVQVIKDNFDDFTFAKSLMDWLVEGLTPIGRGGNPLAEKLIKELEAKVLQQERERTNWRATPSTGKPGRPKGVKNGQGGKGAIRYRMRGGPGPKM